MVSWLELPVRTLKFELQALEGFELPLYPGATFRGALGWALKEVAPPDIYEYLFETRSEVKLRGAEEVPRPFVLEPPVGNPRVHPGDRFELTFRIFGRALEHVGYFEDALEHMGENGLGRDAGRFRVVNALASRIEPVGGPGGIEAQAVEVRFLTPTRLKHQGELVRRPPLHCLIRAALRRLEAMSMVHGDGLEEGADVRELIALSEEVVMRGQEFSWYDVHRRSNRQDRNIVMGGVVGRALYAGPLTPLTPWLEAAERLHVGKGTTLGMGQVEMFFV